MGVTNMDWDETGTDEIKFEELEDILPRGC